MAMPGLPSLPRFEPAEPPLWQRVLGYLREVEEGQTVRWAELSTGLNLIGGSEESLFRAWNKAAGELEAEGWQFQSVGKTGFRRVGEERKADAGAIVEGSVEGAASVELEAPGDAPMWRLAYELLKRAKPGEVVTWEQLGGATGRDPDGERQALRYAVNRAKKRLLKVDRVVVLAVRGQGYSVATPGQQLVLANRHQTRAAREIGKGLALVEAVDPAKLDAETRKGFAVVGVMLNGHQKLIGALSERQQNLEELIAVVADESSAGQRAIEQTNARVAEVEERLEQILRSTVPGEPGPRLAPE